jgi:hypothetical protein
VSFRRGLLVVVTAAWLTMMGAMAYVRYVHRTRDSQTRYAEALFGPDAPVLVSKSVWLRGPLGGPEERIGSYESQLLRIGSNDVHVTHTLEIEADKVSPQTMLPIMMILKAVLGTAPEIENFEGRLDVYVHRLRGLHRIKGRGRYGSLKFDFWGRPRGGKYLQVVSRVGGQERSNLVPFDRRAPFGSGSSPFVGMKNLSVGSTWTVNFFDPFTRRTAKRLIRVAGREKIPYRGKKVDCFLLTAHATGGGPGLPGLDGVAGGSGETAGGEGRGNPLSYGPPSSRAWVRVSDGRLLREEIEVFNVKLAMVLEDMVTAEERDYHDPMAPIGAAGGRPDAESPAVRVEEPKGAPEP